MRYLIAFFLLLCCTINNIAVSAPTNNEKIRSLLTKQVEAWNAGDLDAYMSAYWRHDRLRFSSGNDVTYGFDATLAGYKMRYNNREKMGELSFEILELKFLGKDHAQVFGRWSLKRKDDNPQGLFTLTLEEIKDEWRIISDHTSSQ